MAEVGTVQYNIEVAAEKVNNTINQVLANIDKLLAKAGLLNKANDNLEESSSKLTKVLGAAGLGAALLTVGRHFESSRFLMDKTLGAAKALGIGLLSLITNWKSVMTVVQAVGKGFTKFVELSHLAELGIFSFSKNARDLASALFNVGVAGATTGTALGGLGGIIGTMASQFGTLGFGMLSVVGIVGKLAEALGNRLAESGRKAMAENDEAIAQYIEFEKTAFALTVAVNGYNEAVGNNSANAQEFIQLTTKLSQVTGTARGEIATAVLTLLDFARVTHLNEEQIGKLVETSAEYARVTHQDFQTVIRGIDNVFRGYYRTLQVVGISLDLSKIQANEYATALKIQEKQLGRTLTEQEKQEFRLTHTTATLGEAIKATAVYNEILDKTRFTSGTLSQAQEFYFQQLQQIRSAQQNITISFGEGAASVRKWENSLNSVVYGALNKLPPSLYSSAGAAKEAYGFFADFTGTLIAGAGHLIKYATYIAALKAALFFLSEAGYITSASILAFGKAVAVTTLGITTIVTVFITAAYYAKKWGDALAHYLDIGTRVGKFFKDWVFGAKEAQAAQEDLNASLNSNAENPVNEEVLDKVSKKQETEIKNLRERTVAILAGVEASKTWVDQLEIEQTLAGHSGARYKEQEAQLRLNADAVDNLRLATSAGVKAQETFVDKLKEAHAAQKSGAKITEAAALAFERQGIAMAKLEFETSPIIKDNKNLAESLAAINKKLDENRAKVTLYIMSLRKDIRDFLNETRNLATSISNQMLDASDAIIEATGTEQQRLDAQLAKSRREALDQQNQKVASIDAEARKGEQILDQLSKIGVLRAEDVAYVKTQVKDESTLSKFSQMRLDETGKFVDLNDDQIRAMATVLQKRLDELNALKANVQVQSEHNQKLNESIITLNQEKDLLDKRVENQKLSDDVAKQSIDNHIKELQLARDNTDNASKKLDLDRQIVTAQAQSGAVGAAALRVEISGLQELQKKWHDTFHNNNEAWDQEIANAQNQLKTMGMAAAEEQKIGIARLNTVGEIQKGNDAINASTAQYVALQKAQIDQQIAILQLAIEEETNDAKKRNYQLQINDLKKQEHVLDEGELEVRLLGDQLLQKKLASEHQSTEEIAARIAAEESELKILHLQEKSYDVQAEQIKHLSDETFQLGKNTEDYIANQLGGFATGKLKKPFKDVWSFFQDQAQGAFAATIKNKLHFEDVTVTNLFKDSNGLVNIFGRAWGNVTQQSATASTAMATNVAAGAQAAATSAGVVESAWGSAFQGILALAQNVFGIIGGLGGSALGGLGGLLGMGSAQYGGGAGNRTLGTISSVIGIGSLASRLLGLGNASGGFLGLGGSAIGSAISSVFSLGSNLLGAYTGISGLFQKGQSGFGRLFSGLGAVNSIGNIGLTGANFLASQGLLGSNFVPSTFVGPLQPGITRLPADTLGLLGQGFNSIGLGGVSNFASGIGGYISGLIKSIVQTITAAVSSVLPTAITGAATAAAAAAPAAGSAAAGTGSAVGSAVGSIAPAIPVAGGLAGIALGVKGAIEADNSQARAGSILTAVGGLVAIVVPILGAIIAIIGAIISATAPSSKRAPLRRSFADIISKATGKKAGTGDYGRLYAAGQPGGDLEEAVGPANILAGAALARFGPQGLHRFDMVVGFRNLLINNFAKMGYDLDKAREIIVKITRSFGGLLPTLHYYEEFAKEFAKFHPNADTSEMGQKRFGKRVEDIRSFGDLFNQYAAGVGVGDILAKYVNDNGVLQVKKAIVELRTQILTAIQGGAAFSVKDAKNLGDRFLKAVAKLSEKLGKFVDIAGAAIVVQAANLGDEGGTQSPKKLLKDLSTLIKLQTTLISAALPELTAEQQRQVLDVIDAAGTPKKERRARKLADALVPAEQAINQALKDFTDKLAGKDYLVELDKKLREMKAARFNLDQGLQQLEKLHGKKLDEALKNVPDLISSVTQSVQELADSVMGLRQQILDLIEKQQTTMLDLDKQILNLTKDSGDLTGRITDLYTNRLNTLYDDLNSTQDPTQKLNTWLQIMSTINDKYQALIDETQRQADIEIQAKQDQIDLIDKQLDDLKKQYDVVKALAELHKAVKEDLRQITVSGLGAGATPGRRLKELRSQIATAQADFQGAKEEDKAEKGATLRDRLQELLQFGTSTYQRPSRQFQEILREVTKGLKDIEQATSGKEEQAKSLEEQMKDLDDTRNGLLTDIKGIQTEAKDKIEDLKTKWAEDLQGIEPKLDTAFTDAINDQTTNLQTTLDNIFGPGTDVYKFLHDAGYAKEVLETGITGILNEILKTIQGSIAQPAIKRGLDTVKKALAIATEGTGTLSLKQEGNLTERLDTLRTIYDTLGLDTGILDQLEAAINKGDRGTVKDLLRKIRTQLDTYTGPGGNEETPPTGPTRAQDIAALKQYLPQLAHMAESWPAAQWGSLLPTLEAGINNITDEWDRLQLLDMYLDNIRGKMYHNFDASDRMDIKAAIDTALAQVPAARKGAMVLADTFLRAGEGGRTEAIIPLEDPRSLLMMQKLFESLLSKTGGARGDVYVNLTVHNAKNLNEQAIVDIAKRAFKRELQLGSTREVIRRTPVGNRKKASGF